MLVLSYFSFPGGSEVKASACNVGDLGLIPGLERSPREGIGNPLQYPCLEYSTDRGAWRATVHGVTESDMTEQLTLSLALHNALMVYLMNQFLKDVGADGAIPEGEGLFDVSVPQQRVPSNILDILILVSQYH